MLRLPRGMRERIAEAARANNRSMNSEIVTALETIFTPLQPDDAEINIDEWRDKEVDNTLSEIERLLSRIKEIRATRWPGQL